MLKGAPKASAVSTFRNQVEALAEQNQLKSNAVLTYGIGTVWENGDFKGDPGKPTEIKRAFDRSEIINIFNDVMDPDNPGTAGDKIAMKFQSDYLAAMERAFLTRHSGSIRSEMFAAGRRKFAAEANLRSFTYDTLKAILERGN
jgi:hypothetical protein